MSQARRDFEGWKIKEVYIAQDGVCSKCQDSLKLGFHRHHKDGDPANNSLENLELLCESCHRATFKGPKKKKLEAHKKLEREILANLAKLINKALEEKMAGSTIEKLTEAMTLALRVSKKEKDLVVKLETLPELYIGRQVEDLEAWKKGYQEGFIEAMRRQKGE